MSEIVIPSSFEKVKPGVGIVTPDDKKELERQKYFPDHYDLIAHYIPHIYETNPRFYIEDCELDEKYISNRKKIDAETEALKIASLEDAMPQNGSSIIDSRRYKKYIRPKRVCRFCGRKAPEVKFRKKAHAISELVGNKTVLLRNECDCCNGFFGEVYEDSFSKFTGPARTVAQTNGKEGIPVFDDYTARIEVGNHSEVIQEVVGSDHLEFTEDGFMLYLKKQTYCPLDAFKALVVMALSIMPDSEFKKFDSTVDWIMKRGKFESYDFKNYSSNMIFRFVGGAKPLPVQAWLLRRKSHLLGGIGVYDVPYCQFILEFDNFSFQIIVPNYEQDIVLWDRTVNVPAFISSFDFHPNLGKGTSAGIKDLSSKEKVTGEVEHIFMHADKKIEITEDLEKSVQELTDREGVQPLMSKSKEEGI